MIVRRDMSNAQEFVLYLTAYEVIIKSNMFHTSMKKRISTEIGSSNVITVNSGN